MKSLLSFLLNHFLFAGTMFFAAGAGIAGAGDGGGGALGQATGNEGAGDAGDSVISADDSSDAAGSDDDTAGTTVDAATDPDAPVDLGDGRTVPAKWKALFDAAKTAGLDKDVKQLFFGAQKLTKAFPGGINEAIALKQTLEQHGGVEAIESLKADIQTYEADAQSFLETPDKWAETGFKENPDAALKAFSHSLDIVANQMPEQYNFLMSKIVLNTLDDGPVGELYQFLSTSTDATAKALAQKLAGFYNGIKGMASKVPEKKIDPERQKLEADRTALQGEQEQLRNHTVNSQTIPRLGREITSSLEKEAKAVGFDLKKFETEQPGAYQALRGDILKAVMTEASKDATFTRNYKAKLKQGDTQTAVAMMNQKHDKIMPDIVRALAVKYGIKKAAGAKPAVRGAQPVAAGAGSGAVRQVSAMPPRGEINFDKTPPGMVLEGKAVLKTGETVQWPQ
jgi:hypothetical protein